MLFRLVQRMAEKQVLQTIRFCEDDERHSGAFKVVRTAWADRSVISVEMHTKEGVAALPRSRLKEVIEALMEVDAAASSHYKQLLREMNDGLQQEESG